jgi:hypothetical protein
MVGGTKIPAGQSFSGVHSKPSLQKSSATGPHDRTSPPVRRLSTVCGCHGLVDNEESMITLKLKEVLIAQ